MTKLLTINAAVSKIKNSSSLMIGGFLGCGAPESLITEIIKNGIKDLHIIGNDTGFPDKGCGRLIAAGLVKKVTVSHIGTNPETIRLMNEGKLQVELVPQGTLAERIRAAGAGLGGVLTPTGIGTEVEEGKKKVIVKDKEYLIEEALKADYALLKAYKADEYGNLTYRLTAQNFNPLMATASKTVIAEVEENVSLGDINPDAIVTPHVFVDYIVKALEVKKDD